MSSMEATLIEASRKSAKSESHLVDKDAFLAAFGSGHPCAYYRGESLAAHAEKDAEVARFRDWIWRHVIDGGRGTLVQRRISPQGAYEYMAVPRSGGKL
jgi:hypothetical protein